MPAFDITRPTNSTELDSSRKSSVPFQVTNLTAHNRKVRVAVSVDDDGDASIFSVEGSTERNFQPKGSQTVTVSLHAPMTAAPGTRQFRLTVVDVDSPDEFYGESQSVSFTVPPFAPPVRVTFRVWWLFPIGLVIYSLWLLSFPSVNSSRIVALEALAINAILAFVAIFFSYGETPRLRAKWWWLLPILLLVYQEWKPIDSPPTEPDFLHIPKYALIAVAVILIGSGRQIFGDEGTISVEVPNPPTFPKSK